MVTHETKRRQPTFSNLCQLSFLLKHNCATATNLTCILGTSYMTNKRIPKQEIFFLFKLKFKIRDNILEKSYLATKIVKKKTKKLPIVAIVPLKKKKKRSINLFFKF